MSLWGHSDANNAKRLSILNKSARTPDLGNEIHLFHLNHNINKAVSVNADVSPHNEVKRWIDDVVDYESHNTPKWGLDGEVLPSPSLCELGDSMDDPVTILKRHRKPRRSISVLRIKLTSAIARTASKVLDRMKV